MSRVVVVASGVRTAIGDYGGGGRNALVTMCIGGRQQIAAVFERM